MKNIFFNSLFGATIGFALINPSYADSELLRNPSNDHIYQRFDQSLGWHTSKQDCERRGGYLATVTDADESDFILANFIKGKNPGGIWLGATNELGKEWRWVTDETWQFNNWNEGEPNNAGGTIQGGSENYLVIGHFQDRSKWNDINTYNHGLLIFSEFLPVSRLCEWDSEASYITISSQE